VFYKKIAWWLICAREKYIKMIGIRRGSTIIIKKYPNRRLYNTQISSYITLLDLFDMVKKSIDFKVLDSKSNEDITNSLLIQIIFDQEMKSYSVLPTSILKKIISYYHGNNFIIPAYLELFMNSVDPINESPIKIFEDIAKNNVELIENGINMFYKSFSFKK